MFLKLGRYMNPGPPVMRVAAPAAAMPSSTVFDIDATIASSYPGTGTTITNLIPAPPVAGTYDFACGSLAFTGSAGSPSAYLNADHVSDVIFFDDSGGTPDFILDFHKSVEGQAGWIGQAFRMGTHTSSPGTLIALFGNENNPANQGFAVYYTFASEQIRLQIADGGSGVTFDWTYPLEAEGHYIILFSLSHTGGDTAITLYINGVSQGTVTHAVSTTTDAGSILGFMNDDTTTGTLVNQRFYWAGMGNDALTQDDADSIQEILETRHNRAYEDDNFAYSLATVAGINADWEFDPRVPSSHSYTDNTIRSLIKTPTLGARSAYEWWRGFDSGTASAKPTNTGTAFQSNGDDTITLKNVTGTSIAKYHRSDRAGSWIGLIITTEASLAGAETWFANTGGTATGVRLILQTDERLDFTEGNGAASNAIADISSILTSGTYFIVLTWDGTSATDNFKVAINSTTFTAFSDAFGVSMADSTAVLRFLSGATGTGSFAGSGTELKWAAGGSDFLSDTDLANIVALLEGANRHNTDYTP